MAQERFILGKVSGKLGNNVYYVHNEKQCVRSLPEHTPTEASHAQLTQQAKMATVTQFVSSLKVLLKTSYRLSIERMTPYNDVVKYTFKHAVIGTYPFFAIDYSKVLVSKGYLLPVNKARARCSRGNIVFNWDDGSDTGFEMPDDKAILVAYCPALNKCIFTAQGPERRDEVAFLAVPDFRGHTVHTWLGFLSADGKQAANSVYTGEVMVT